MISYFLSVISGTNTQRLRLRGCELDNHNNKRNEPAWKQGYSDDCLDTSVACFDESQGGLHPDHPYWAFHRSIVEGYEHHHGAELTSSINRGHSQIELLRLKYGWESTHSQLNGTFLSTTAMVELTRADAFAARIEEILELHHHGVGLYSSLEEHFEVSLVPNIPAWELLPEEVELRDLINHRWKQGDGDDALINIMERRNAAVRRAA